MKPILLLCNCPSSEEAERIADALVEERLAAAVQIAGPLDSRYRWQGQVQRTQEWTLLIKSSDTCATALNKRIKQLHSYQLPGVLRLDIGGGESQYLQWILAQTTAPPAC